MSEGAKWDSSWLKKVKANSKSARESYKQRISALKKHYSNGYVIKQLGKGYITKKPNGSKMNLENIIKSLNIDDILHFQKVLNTITENRKKLKRDGYYSLVMSTLMMLHHSKDYKKLHKVIKKLI